VDKGVSLHALYFFLSSVIPAVFFVIIHSSSIIAIVWIQTGSDNELQIMVLK